jgi:hypothetical protein
MPKPYSDDLRLRLTAGEYDSRQVARTNYVGPAGGLLTAGEQCAFALQNCIEYRHNAYALERERVFVVVPR